MMLEELGGGMWFAICEICLKNQAIEVLGCFALSSMVALLIYKVIVWKRKKKIRAQCCECGCRWNSLVHVDWIAFDGLS